MKNIFKILIPALLTAGCTGETGSNMGNNSAVISPGSSIDEIVEIAANIAPSAPQLRWQQLEYVAFFHFGINTFTDREWGEGTEDPAIFNPSALDARQWVTVCRDAGMKQVIITAKHHDGFCLWPSNYTEHTVKNSPWKGGNGDVVREVAEACHEMGIGFGVYLSPWDRNNPSYGDSPKYNDYFVNQLTELLTEYGKVDEVWFDGACGEGPNGKRQVYDWSRYYSLIRKLQPQAVIAIMGPDVRWVGTESGYGRETEWSVIPASLQSTDSIAAASQQNADFIPQMDFQKQDLGGRDIIRNASRLVWYPAETDVSIRPGWFYHESQDSLVKTPEKLMDIYFSSVGYNSVLLLNIPPDRHGLIHENDIKSLMGFKKLREQLFNRNFVPGSRLSSDGRNDGALIDGNPATHWTTHGGETGTIEINLPEAQTIDVLCLQENISIGQRIEKFRLEYREDDQWREAGRGTTAGYMRLLRFSPVASDDFRIVIQASRLNPLVGEIGLYKSPLSPN